MNIEKAIKQSSPFASEFEKLSVNLMFTHAWLKKKLSLFFRTYGLTTKQYNILRILKGADKPVSTSFIRDRMLERMSDTTRIIDRMQKKLLVDKKICSMDMRLIDITIADKGYKLLESINLHSQFLDKIFTDLDENEARKLNQLLDKSRIN